MTRTLYRGLVRMHPPAFRSEFAAEMLWIYDEAAGETGGVALVLDAFLSLLRQWGLRSGSWKILAALAGGLFQVSFAAALMRHVGPYRPPAALAEPNPDLDALMRLVALITVGLVSAVIALVFWWRMQARRRGV